MILNGSVASGTMAMKLGPCNVKQRSFLAHSRLGNTPSYVSIGFGGFPKLKGLSLAHQERNVLPLRGGSTQDFVGPSIFPIEGDFASLQNKKPWSPWSCKVKSSFVCKASKSLIYPQMEAKPQWWWRSLACVPYLLPISDTLVQAALAFQLTNFLEEVDFLTFPLISTFTLLPGWALIAMSTVGYICIVRRKEWPHFLRFHVVMAMLLSSAVQVVGIASHWLPRSVYNGGIQRYFWSTVVYLQLLVLLECIRCALGGVYADVPFVKDAARIHTEA
ncbi:protein TIC 20-I, chloroplastic-like [Dioscorea cayenensis subsp. rotundata]|uniref:Protein TIC 20 n=1 Tax=Dioscorea cayennensis subsp. rotundata TaxID=55577 RepID=A0AB40BSL8_DIOCR|nr:protein TIC 20-I, chloroplastic-like [Dioscorea cayenensis subsp. rotundata]